VSQFFSDYQKNRAARSFARPRDESLRELRRLLLYPEQLQIKRLTQRLDNPQKHAEEISQVLPEAVVLCLARDGKLTAQLVPHIEKVVQASVKKNRNLFADALFPLMGPVVRKAISEALGRMIQSMNQTLENSFTLKGLKWRMEAYRTGKTFAEVVLLHSLVYRVEQVFLIHKETGLMLAHVVAEEIDSPDADLISAMLTAIDDFVRDSFHTDASETLDTIQMGELTIWIEPGSQAILAAVIRGRAPETLRQSFRDVLESIHLEQAECFDTFDGDIEPFQSTKPYLQTCLTAQYETKGPRRAFFFWILFVLLLAGLGTWLVFHVQKEKQWETFLSKVKAEPGIIVTTSQKSRGKRLIAGFRDPLAADPADLLQNSELADEKVKFRWEPYQAIHPEFVAARSRRLLNPPETVSLEFKDGILAASGLAPHRWIYETRILARSIAGVTAFKEENLIDADISRLEAAKKTVENASIYFQLDKAELIPGYEMRLEKLAADVKKLRLLAEKVGRRSLYRDHGAHGWDRCGTKKPAFES
jgi:outer membrane protein OmpA-like peptidoglycan-associated protein